MDIPQKWLDVLHLVQHEFPGAVIAGGALRDLEFGLKPKDVDIFFHAPAYSSDTIAKLMKLFPGLECSIEPQDLYPNGSMAGDLLGVYNYEEDGEKYQFIEMTQPFTPQSLIDKFDWGLDMITASDAGHIVVDPRFDLDKLNRHFTLYTDKALSKSMERYKRLYGKFDGWPAVMPYVRGKGVGATIASTPGDLDDEIPF